MPLRKSRVMIEHRPPGLIPLIRYLGGVILEGGAESSASLLSSLILSFVAFPETLKKAQNEIDTVISDGRAPTMDDIASLPYIRAILREVS